MICHRTVPAPDGASGWVPVTFVPKVTGTQGAKVTGTQGAKATGTGRAKATGTGKTAILLNNIVGFIVTIQIYTLVIK